MKNILLLLARLILFGGLFLVAITLFSESAFSLAAGILDSRSEISFQPHLMALLGLGLASLSILIWLVIEQLSGTPPATSAAKLIGRALGTGLVLAIALPILARFTIPTILEDNGYSLCEQAAYPYHLPGLGEKVYTNSAEHCEPWND